MQIIDFLNQNAGALSVVFAAIVTFATVLYSILTWRLVSETVKMRKAQTDAQVSVTFNVREESVGWIDLMIQNEGMGPAKDVKFKIQSTSEECCKEILDSIDELEIFKVGIPYLAKDQVIKSFFVSTYGNYEEITNSVLRIEISYKSIGNIRHCEETVLNFPSLRGLSQLGKPPLHVIADDITTLRKNIEKVVSGSKKIKIVSYSLEDIKKEKDEFKELIAYSA